MNSSAANNQKSAPMATKKLDAESEQLKFSKSYTYWTNLKMSKRI